MVTVLERNRITARSSPKGVGERRGLLARSAALLLVAVVFAGACSSDADPLTLDEYFAELEAIDADVDSQFEALFAEFPEDEDSFADEANLPLFKDLVVGFPRIMGDLIDSAKHLEPPSELRDAHDKLIDTGEILLVAFEEGSEALAEADTMAEWETLTRELDPAISVAEAAFDAACIDVVAIGMANDIHVDVTCEDE